jgi:hypothetical protein
MIAWSDLRGRRNTRKRFVFGRGRRRFDVRIKRRRIWKQVRDMFALPIPFVNVVVVENNHVGISQTAASRW